MDQRIKSVVYVKVLLSEPINFPLSICTTKEIGDRTRQRKNLRLRLGIKSTNVSALATELQGQMGASHFFASLVLVALHPSHRQT